MGLKVWSELWKAMQDQFYVTGEPYSEERPAPERLWVETTTEMSDEMLNVLPPEEWERGAFLVGEAWNHNAEGRAVYSCFCERDGRHYAKYLTRQEFKAETFDVSKCLQDCEVSNGQR